MLSHTEPVARSNAIADAVFRIGNTKLTMCPPSNSDIDGAAQEYYTAYKIKQSAERRYEAAKADLLGLLPVVPPEPDTYTLHDSAFVFVSAQVKASAMRLDESKVVALLAERCDMDVTEALALLKQECYSPAKPAVVLSVLPKK